MTSIEVDENNTAYKSIDGNLYTKDGKTLLQYAIGKTATTFIVSDAVTSIGSYAFEDCDGLTSVTIGKSVTSIGAYAFARCSSLTSIVIPDSVTSIGSYAFYNCTSLTSVIIGDSVTSIGEDAFYNCTSLTSITFKDTSTWYYTTSSSGWENKTGGLSLSVTNPSYNAANFKGSYRYYWYKK
ncbi:MAG: leucine-rich repeat domain-containing protein [Clostridia bacterium]|nr:leucine-rich repeat domain-containing protein [Clostridia bacterium]